MHALHYSTTGSKCALLKKYALNKHVRLLTRLYGIWSSAKETVTSDVKRHLTLSHTHHQLIAAPEKKNWHQRASAELDLYNVATPGPLHALSCKRSCEGADLAAKKRLQCI